VWTEERKQAHSKKMKEIWAKKTGKQTPLSTYRSSTWAHSQNNNNNEK